MQNCPRHNVPLTFRTGSGEKGPWQVWSCPKKDGDNYCKEKVWSRGKTPAEEMVNLLGDILMALKGSTAPTARPTALRQDEPIRV